MPTPEASGPKASPNLDVMSWRPLSSAMLST
jgi:hypothetical protein